MSTESNGDLRARAVERANTADDPDFSPTAYWLGVITASAFKILIGLALWIAALALSGFVAVKSVELFLSAV